MVLKIKLLLPYFLLFGLILLYVHNLSRSVYGGDVGDFVTAAFVGGVPHPPGFPLFTLLGFLLTKVPIAVSPAFKVGLISAAASALGIFFYYRLALKVTKTEVVALISSLALAFSYLFWLHAEIAEVFGLNNFFVVILFYFAYSFYKNGKPRDLFLLSFLSGLSLTNHQTIILIFPSLLILSYSNLIKTVKKTPKVFALSLILFLSALLVYAYVPIASSRNPVVNWDNVHDLKSFTHLVLRKDYGTFTAGLFDQPNMAQRIVAFRVYFKELVNNVTFPVFVLSLIGIFGLIKKERKFSISIITGFLLIGPAFIFYAGFPLINSFFIGVYERFFTASIVVLLLALPYGIYYSVNTIPRFLGVRKIFLPTLYCVFLILPLTLFFYNFPKLDLSNQYAGDNLSRDILDSTSKNSVLILSGDTAYFNTMYARYALGFRKDVEVINLNDVGKSNLFRSSEKDYQKTVSVKNDRDIVIHVLAFVSKERPVFSYVPILSKQKDEIWLPMGLSYRLVDKVPPKDEYIKSLNEVWKKITLPSIDQAELSHRNLTISELPTIYADFLLTTGAFFQTRYSDNRQAFAYYSKAEALAPDYPKTNQILGVYYLSIKDCRSASVHFRSAVDNDHLTQLNYYLLYSTYKECMKDNQKANSVLAEYKDVFGTGLIEDVKKVLKK